MHFIFLNRNNEKFFDENYKKVYLVNEYVHQIDFSCYDKNQKICEEAAKKEKERQKQNDINNLSTEDEKEYTEKYTLTPTPERNGDARPCDKPKGHRTDWRLHPARRCYTIDATSFCSTKLNGVIPPYEWLGQQIRIDIG